jgi:6-phosphogluconolactonase (cycloisomerase 2 family)
VPARQGAGVVCARKPQLRTEINKSMSKRFAWLFGLGGLVLIGFLVACGQIYNSQSNGLVIVTSQGSGLLETYSYDLNGGGNVNGVSNPPESTAEKTCVLNGFPGQVVIDTAGAYAYAIVTANSFCGSGSKTGIQAFKINSAGEIANAGGLVSDPSPIAISMDTTGKFLFVVEGCLGPSGSTPVAPCLTNPGVLAPYIRSYAIGSGGSLTFVQATYTLNLPPGFQTPNFVAVAPTPMTLPTSVNGVQTSYCSGPGNKPPTTEFLYAVDAVNSAVWEFGVNTSSGAITNPPNTTQVQNFVTGSVPYGVVVEPCNRFVYVTDFQSNQVSGYSICNGMPTQSPLCPNLPPGSLQPIQGSPFTLTTGSGPGPLVADPFGNNIYVLDTLSNQITPFHIATTSGSLTSGTVASTGSQPTWIAIRGDDNWLFVANYNSQTFSEFQITPATGALSALPTVTTDNYPYGIAVK